MTRPEPHRDHLTEAEALAVFDAFMADVRAKDKTWDRTLTVLKSTDKARRDRRSR